ncbi:MAG TPA: FAD-linked oxidase C-terminal domain-containing protein [Gaiellaceae bacterium]
MAQQGLARELAATIEGEVRFDAGSRALYATDLSIYRQVPIGVVVPRTIEDVVTTVDACRAYDVPIFGRGCGSSLVGQCCNEAVVVDFSKYLNKVLEVDPERKLARAQPGAICDHIRDAAEEHRLTFGPDPATHRYATLGGMLGNNSCGVHSVMTQFYGPGPRTSDNVEELEILTYGGDRLRLGNAGEDDLEQIVGEGGPRGEFYGKLRDLRDRYGDLIRERYPQIPRRVSGYNLDELLPEKGFNVASALVGTESTCALTLEATVRLVESPQHRTLVVIGYPDQFVAADHIIDILEHRPIGLEAVDRTVTDNMRELGLHPAAVRLYPDGNAWLLAEFGGDSPDEAAGRAHDLAQALKRQQGEHWTKVVEDGHEQAQIWLVRETSIGASRIPRKLETWPTFEDASVAPEQLGAYLRDFKKLLDRHELRCVFFGHYGQGCVHARIGFDLKTEHGLDGFRRFHDEATDLVVSYGGSLSGEHGDGQAHGHALGKMYGEELLEAFREFKRVWDPGWKLNPGKKIDAYAPDANLRLGTSYRPPSLRTNFSFHEDGFSFAAATERCFGVGLCRRLDGGTMCPSFRATREETHTTRGRAHMLFELLRGGPLRGGWRDEHVHEALDLCLSCKGCKGDCPVHVDVATYKAEFLSHYWAGRARPLSHYALGLVWWWARAASRAPMLANALAPLGRSFVGIAPERGLPRFARRTFRDWFAARPPRTSGRRVLLWPDTFTNFFDPQVGIAAVEVLEAAGCRVELPRQMLCCGRPLYDFGMLMLAKRQLRGILEALRPEIQAGVPIVGLEPSCVAVFRDELCNLFPHDEDARRLRTQTRTLAELLAELDWAPPKLERRALVQPHCHHRAIMGLDPDQALLARLGLDAEVLDAGCCGMAGSFGYEAGEKYDVSVRVAEDAVAPRLRAEPDALLVADGFSCRTQIEHVTGRRALHLAEAIRLALPEPQPSQNGRRNHRLAAAALAGLALAAGVAYRARR